MRDVRIELVPCPRCGAPAGRPCVSPAGTVLYTMAHFARREAAIAAGEYEPA